MKTYTFTTTNSGNTTSCNTFICPNRIDTDYSAIIDAALDANIKKKNNFLFDCFTTPKSSSKTINITINGGLKNDKLAYATDFLANLSKPKFKTCGIELDKIYKLDDGTPIIFFEDSIQIGLDLYYFNDFKNPFFISNLTPTAKKTICTIFTGGLKIEIKK